MGSLRDINNLTYLTCVAGDVRTASWLDASGTWVTLSVSGPIDLDHVVTSTHAVSVAEWRRVTGLSA